MAPETLLIIDDEPSILESLSMFLQDEGYQVLTAENGQRGLELFYTNSVDLVITDLRMPVADGNQVMGNIKAHCRDHQLPEPPMIVISGVGEKEDIINALRMGAKDYITKPFEDLDMISHTIKKAVETKRLEEQNRQYRKDLEKSEAQYRTITHQVAEGVFTVDEKDRITLSNPAFCQMTGYAAEELLNKDFKSMVRDRDRPRIEEQTQLRKTGEKGRYELQLQHREGHMVHAEIACSPLPSETGEYIGAIAVIRDISRLIELRKKYQEFMAREGDKSKDLIALCANCKSIRDKEKGWLKMEEFFSNIIFSHGICPDCCEKLYPELDLSELDDSPYDI